MSYNGSERKQVREREKEAKRADDNRIAYTKQIMVTLPGREWMHALLESCYLFGEPFVRGSADATAHNLGRQSVGKQIFADIVTHCPDYYILMMQEANVKEIVHDRRNRDERSATTELDRGTDSGRDTEGRVGEYDPYADGDAELDAGQ